MSDWAERLWSLTEVNPLSYQARRCRLCDRELLLADGRRPFPLLGPEPDFIEEQRSVLFDNHQRRLVTYRFCSEQHRATYESWERNPESR